MLSARSLLTSRPLLVDFSAVPPQPPPSDPQVYADLKAHYEAELLKRQDRKPLFTLPRPVWEER